MSRFHCVFLAGLGLFAASSAWAQGANPAMSAKSSLSELQVRVIDSDQTDAHTPTFSITSWNGTENVNGAVSSQFEIERVSLRKNAPEWARKSDIEEWSHLNTGYFQTVAPYAVEALDGAGVAATTGSGYTSFTAINAADFEAQDTDPFSYKSLKVKSGWGSLQGQLSAGATLEISGVISAELSSDQSALAPLLARLRGTGDNFQLQQLAQGIVKLTAWTSADGEYQNLHDEWATTGIGHAYGRLNGVDTEYFTENFLSVPFTLSFTNVTGKDVDIMLMSVAHSDYYFSQSTPVPEAQTWATFGLGLLGILGLGRRSRTSADPTLPA